MPTPKLYSRAMITIILLCMLQVTLVTGICSFLIGYFFVDNNTQEVFLYLIDFAAPVTLLTALSHNLDLGLGILTPKTVLFKEKKEDSENTEATTTDKEATLIMQISLSACFITVAAIILYEIIYYLIFHIPQIINALNIIMLPIIVFGLFFLYLAFIYVFNPLFVILNLIISSLTNRIFNALFSNLHERMMNTPKIKETHSDLPTS